MLFRSPGDEMELNLKGSVVKVKIPATIGDSDGRRRKIRPGDKFTFQWGFREKVIASTLPALPGATVAEAKPMIYANVAERSSYSDRTVMSTRVGDLMQEAQTMLLQRAIELGCNAVLSINCNVSTDSHGSENNWTTVIVTLIGTPCVVMPLESMPLVEAEATLLPEMISSVHGA